ncbi:LOB domain-containing protein 19-like [Solanum dulcamara]|uniref:LOB domain-containing protein 19-like n=1 Tax=Solanum dulcamara TaxID=45834 RepID=UPI002485B317|nr:LOB domain-containing protein 19-like [Solanum dulcamara]
MNGDCGGGGVQYYSNSNNNCGPCGACKFLRSVCCRGTIFAPYFDSDQGTAHFAAVHKVFGASNASKLLLTIPTHKRLDAVVTLCYEALARVRDPIYGSCGHIFTLRQQVVTLQAELSHVQAHLSTLAHHFPLSHMPQPQSPITPTGLQSSTSSSSMEQYHQLDIIG